MINDFPRKGVYIHTSTTEDVNPVMAVKHGSTRASFQAVCPSWQQRTLESICVDQFELSNFTLLNDASECKNFSGAHSIRGQLSQFISIVYLPWWTNLEHFLIEE